MSWLEFCLALTQTLFLENATIPILSLLMAYGLRAKDLAGLKTENIDFQHCRLSFQQSKTGAQYSAELLPAVKNVLESYLSEANPQKEGRALFCSAYALCRPLNRGAVWSIVSKRISAAAIQRAGARVPMQYAPALQASLIAEDIPYPVVQEILGRADPNAAKRYIAIDIERLRKCSLECLAATGQFLSYLEGGEWK